MLLVWYLWFTLPIRCHCIVVLVLTCGRFGDPHPGRAGSVAVPSATPTPTQDNQIHGGLLVDHVIQPKSPQT